MSEMTSLQFRRDEIGKRYLAGESSYDIAKNIGVHPENIRQILIRLDISRKTRKELNRFRANSVNLSPELRSRVNGWLLGDGGISYSGFSGLFHLTSKHKEYVNFAQRLFESEGIKCKTYTNIDKKYKTEGHKLFTISTLEFAELYHKWYLNGKKIVPKDI